MSLRLNTPAGQTGSLRWPALRTDSRHHRPLVVAALTLLAAVAAAVFLPSQQARAEQPEPLPDIAPIGGLAMPQMEHAATIVQVGQDIGLPEQAYVVALATAMQESTLQVLASSAVPASFDHPHEGTGYDHDSVGLFQQRPSMGWGTVAELMDPEHAARTFYEALEQVPGWEGMSVAGAAQAVQRSAFPGHYAQHEPLARDLVSALT